VKLTIDNQDGTGPNDYTALVSGAVPLRIERTLNAPSACTFTLAGCGAPGALPVPSRNGRLVITDTLGAYLFTGYLAVEPVTEFTGASVTGPVYQYGVSAISDEFLLNKQNLPQTGSTGGQSVGTVFRALTARVGPAVVNVDPSLQTLAVGHFLPNPGETWSQNAGAIAAQARAVYRSVGGTISVSPVGSVVHTFLESDGSLQVAGLTASRARMLANDVTICGEIEPSAYVTELFQGDGTTSLFELSRLPFIPLTSQQAKPLKDTFQAGAINPLLWAVNDSGSALSVTSSGLKVNGGNGIDGQTAVSSIDQIELGGSVIAEADGVLIGAGSVGILCGLYSGGSTVATGCVAGFRVKQVAGVTVIISVIGGVETGGSFNPGATTPYTLRIRLHCSESQRVLQSYQTNAGGTSTTFGGSQPPCLANIVMEVQDVTNGANGPSTVLYDGTLPNAPAACVFAPISSLSMVASIRNVIVSQTGSVWVVNQPLGGGSNTKRLGPATNGSQCRVLRNGKLRFYAGNVPAAGDLITVYYRTSRRAVARVANPASIAGETTLAVPGTSRWSGSVVRPAARSSADCENAALALLSFTADRNAAWQGQYTAWNLQNGVGLSPDVWPGDVLAITFPSAGLTANLVVRLVRVEIGSGFPETAKYVIQFANDWAEELSMKLSTAVPADGWIPPLAQPTTPAPSAQVLASLIGLIPGAVTGTNIPINAGQNAPVGGGFEVRRTDWAFRAGSDPDLVLRSPVPNFNIPREGPIEQYYIRMYDGSTPPLYSRYSSGVFVNI
jgi:hypothetical protein